MQIIVPPLLVSKCIAKASAAVKNNTAKKYRDKYSKGMQSRSNNIETSSAAFIAEVAVCMYLGLDPENELTWKPERPDGGYDIKVYGKSSTQFTTIDVKASTHQFASRLMWPITKLSKLSTAADVFVLAIVCPNNQEDGGRFVSLRGWITRDEFIHQHFRAYGLTGIMNGTPYMDEKALYSMEQIVQHLGHIEATKDSV